MSTVTFLESMRVGVDDLDSIPNMMKKASSAGDDKRSIWLVVSIILLIDCHESIHFAKNSNKIFA